MNRSNLSSSDSSLSPCRCSLLLSAGSIARSLPVMALAYFVILRAWGKAVHDLADLHICSFTNPDPQEQREKVQPLEDVSAADWQSVPATHV